MTDKKDFRSTKLDDNAVANRLAYFLWSSLPDQELLKAAATGRLKTRDDLLREAKRMLADPKTAQLVRNFGGQWLSVREYGSVQPAAEYKNYESK